MCESRLGNVNMNKVNRPQKEGQAHLVCPGCHTQYEMLEYAAGEDRPICPECGLPLLRSEKNHKSFKCFRCIHRAIVPDGIWCRQLNCAATAEIAKDCRHFAPRSKRKSRR